MTVVALMGKAGSGKDTLLHKLIETYPDRYHEIVSCTTRPPREGEVDGVNYYFLTIEEFTERLLNGDLLEATEFNNWHYGTLKSTLSEDKINIGVFNPEGVITLSEDPSIDLIIWWIQAEDKTRLIRQLNREKNPDVDEIIRRFKTDKEDFDMFEDTRIPRVLFKNETEEDIDTFIRLFGRAY